MKNLVALSLVTSLFVGCASVPMESKEMSEQAKQFEVPSDGMSGVYIYRTGGVGTALKKDVWIDGDCVGETAPKVFFYEEIPAGEHVVSTESEFSPNELPLTTLSGELYFVKQYIRMGVFVGGANLEVSSADEGMKSVSELDMAKKGRCSE